MSKRKIDSTEKCESILEEIEPLLPSGVHYLGPLLGGPRCGAYLDDPKQPAPNPIRNHPYSGYAGFHPLIAGAELFRPIQGRRGGCLYTVHFVLNDLLTEDEVRSKITDAAQILASQRGETCLWTDYLDELDKWDEEGFPEEPLGS